MLDKKRLILYCDRAIVACLCLLIFCLPFTKAAAESFTWAAIFLWLLKRILGYRTEVLWGLFPKTALNRALSVYVFANILSVIFCSKLNLFLRGFFGKELKFLLIYFMLVEVINNKKRLLSILIAIIASAVLLTVDGGVQYFTGRDFLRGNYMNSFCASFFAGSGFAGWLIIIIPTLLGILAAKIIANVKLKILFFVMIGIQILYLLLTYSRGAWIGFLIAILFVLVYFIKKLSLITRVLFLTACVYLLILLIFLPHILNPQLKYEILTKFKFSQTLNNRVKSIPQITTGSNLERVMLWKEALKIIRDYPITGCGLNNYSIVARHYKSFEGGGVYPHNSFLQKTAEIGIVGLLAFLFLLFSFFKIGVMHLKKKKNYLVLGFLAGILAFSVQSFFDTNLYSLQMVVLFWYILGLTIAVIKLDSSK
ncbi:MAG: O-antigen ligase family protein [Candidatus Omnitrophica bacterium]|nr:O-antigen ligase family protein [Candidatus Omnitrophota bacterium]